MGSTPVWLTAAENLSADGRFVHLRQSCPAAYHYSPRTEAEQRNVRELSGRTSTALRAKFEMIHGDTPTLNYTLYPKKVLRGDGVQTGYASYTNPNPVPLLLNHDVYEGDPKGRCVEAWYQEIERVGTLFAWFRVNDMRTVEKLLDGTYLTSSIHARTDAFTCSICGTNLLQDWCEHWRGREYDGETCLYVSGTYWAIEHSLVNQPGDVKSRVIDLQLEAELGDEHFHLDSPRLYEALTRTVVGIDGLRENHHTETPMNPTLGALFGLQESHPRFNEEGPFSTEQLDAMPDSQFLLSERRIPMADTALAQALVPDSTWQADQTSTPDTQESAADDTAQGEPAEGAAAATPEGEATPGQEAAPDSGETDPEGEAPAGLGLAPVEHAFDAAGAAERLAAFEPTESLTQEILEGLMVEGLPLADVIDGQPQVVYEAVVTAQYTLESDHQVQPLLTQLAARFEGTEGVAESIVRRQLAELRAQLAEQAATHEEALEAARGEGGTARVVLLETIAALQVQLGDETDAAAAIEALADRPAEALKYTAGDLVKRLGRQPQEAAKPTPNPIQEAGAGLESLMADYLRKRSAEEAEAGPVISDAEANMTNTIVEQEGVGQATGEMAPDGEVLTLIHKLPTGPAEAFTQHLIPEVPSVE